MRVRARVLGFGLNPNSWLTLISLGWQAMCTPVEGRCEPRNWWYNLSIQVLNVLFTYGVLVTMPSNPAPTLVPQP